MIEKISKNPRHRDLIIISSATATRRAFDGWNFGLATLAKDDELLRRFGQFDGLCPAKLNALTALSILQALSQRSAYNVSAA